MTTHRYRLNFGKSSELRYTSHLDTHRALERTFRRAKLPLAYTQGFNPKPRINIGAALPLGFTSKCEIADFWLEDDLRSSEINGALASNSPPGLIVNSVTEVKGNAQSLQSQIVATEYRVKFLEPPDSNILQEKIAALLDSEQIMRERRGKGYDLRALVLSLEGKTDDDEGYEILMRLSSLPGATGRPEEVCLQLGIDPNLCSIHRSALQLDLNAQEEKAPTQE